MKQFFKSGDKVVCKERHPDSSIYVSWNPQKDEIVGVTGFVVDCSDHYVRVDFGGKHETLIWKMDPKWLERVDTPKETMSEDKNFNLGDKVVCREKHPDCDSPNWVKDMDRIVGVVGTVVGLTPYIRVKYCKVYGEPSPIEWSLHRDWLDYALTLTQNNMTSPADTAKATATAKAKETFTTTLSSQEALITVKALKVYAHMSDKVAYYRVHLGENAYFNDTPIEYVLKPPKKEETPEPEKPKFQKGDIVVCKERAKTIPKYLEWTERMTSLLGVPGRVVSSDTKCVRVEYPGHCPTTWVYPEDCLEHETAQMVANTRVIFNRLDDAKKA